MLFNNTNLGKILAESRSNQETLGYNAHPKVVVSYKGGNNKKSANHYASMKPKDNNHGNGSTLRTTNKNDRKTASKPKGNDNHHLAQNNSKGNSKGHFGRK